MEKPQPTMTLAQARKRRLMSAHKLADAAGVNPTTINRIEAGVKPRLDTIEKLTIALDMRPEEILWPGDPLGLNDDIS